MQPRPANYGLFQDKLGKDARLGFSFYLLDSEGNVTKEDGFNQHLMMPMASTFKIALALLCLKKVFGGNHFKLSDEIKISDDDFSPGHPFNTLDRNFFIPFATEETRTLDELLSLMLQNSDNTATDKILNLVGGPQAVNDFMKQLDLYGCSINSSTKQMIGDYYDVQTKKSVLNILDVCWNFLTAFNLREDAEQALIKNKEDVCTPAFSNELLTFIVREANSSSNNWLNEAAKYICKKMEGCDTGKDLIRKGCGGFSAHIQNFGDKTGSLGGIVNDTAFIQLKNNGMWVILSVFTCLSPIELNARRQVIADITNDILQRNLADVCCDKVKLIQQ